MCEKCGKEHPKHYVLDDKDIKGLKAVYDALADVHNRCAECIKTFAKTGETVDIGKTARMTAMAVDPSKIDTKEVATMLMRSTLELQTIIEALGTGIKYFEESDIDTVAKELAESIGLDLSEFAVQMKKVVTDNVDPVKN